MLRDNAFDLDPFVLEDLPFAAYYPMAEVVAPTAPKPPTGFIEIVGPPRDLRRRRRWRVEHVHVMSGGLAVNGSAEITFRTPHLDRLHRDDDELLLDGLL